MSGVAYGDESIRRTGLESGVYLLGAYIGEAEDASLADALSVFVRRRGKLHWQGHVPKVKRVVCETIAASDAQHLVVIASPLPADGGEERARQRALATLAHVLVEEYGVVGLVMERRERTQDMVDAQTIEVARRSGTLPRGFWIRHVAGAADRRLWVPDQVIGALGDDLAGLETGWLLIKDRVRVLEIQA